MTTYIERFNAMVEEIRSHPLLEVMDYSMNPSASKKVFDVVEQKIGAALAEPIHSFYGEANGLTLHWRVRQPSSQKEADKIAKKYNDYDIEFPENEDIPFAQINLLPLEECMINRSWPELELGQQDRQIEFAGATYTSKDFAKMLKPFDVFSTYYCMAFVVEQGIGNPKAVLLGDYYIEWDNSRITDFASYMELLLVTRGIVESRNKIYNEYRGDRKPPLITGPDYWKQKHIPKLFGKKK